MSAETVPCTNCDPHATTGLFVANRDGDPVLVPCSFCNGTRWMPKPDPNAPLTCASCSRPIADDEPRSPDPARGTWCAFCYAVAGIEDRGNRPQPFTVSASEKRLETSPLFGHWYIADQRDRVTQRVTEDADEDPPRFVKVWATSPMEAGRKARERYPWPPAQHPGTSRPRGLLIETDDLPRRRP